MFWGDRGEHTHTGQAQGSFRSHNYSLLYRYVTKELAMSLWPFCLNPFQVLLSILNYDNDCSGKSPTANRCSLSILSWIRTMQRVWLFRPLGYLTWLEAAWTCPSEVVEKYGYRSFCWIWCNRTDAYVCWIRSDGMVSVSFTLLLLLSLKFITGQKFCIFYNFLACTWMIQNIPFAYLWGRLSRWKYTLIP